MSEQQKMDQERAHVVDAMCLTWRHDFGLDKRPDEFGSSGMTDDERNALRRQMGQLYDHHIAHLAANSLPVGVPDGQVLLAEARMVIAACLSECDLPAELEWMAERASKGRRIYTDDRALLAAAPAAQPAAVTPEFVWLRLLEAMAGDNGCAFTSSTDDYREAKPAITALISAGFFSADHDSLDGDIWMVAAGEQGEAAARFEGHASAYVMLSDVLNRVFEQPAAEQSAPGEVEEITVVAVVRSLGFGRVVDPVNGESLYQHCSACDQLMTVAQHKRIVAQLAARDAGQPALTVWEGAMPESNGKSNFTAVLMRKGAELFDGISGGLTIARSEYPDRVRYEADCVRWLIGELKDEPCITGYDADKHSGYKARDDGVVLVPEGSRVVAGFEVIERKHVPTVTIRLPATHADDSEAWDRRDGIANALRALLAQRERGGDDASR